MTVLGLIFGLIAMTNVAVYVGMCRFDPKDVLLGKFVGLLILSVIPILNLVTLIVNGVGLYENYRYYSKYNDTPLKRFLNRPVFKFTNRQR